MSEKKDCFWQGRQYSEGAEVCQSGALKECVAGSWVNRGKCPEPDSSEDYIRQLVEQTPIIDEEQKSEYEKLPVAEGQILETYQAYASHFSVVQNPDYTYFKGGPTVGQACLEVNSYRIFTQDIIYVGPMVDCPPGRGWVRLYKWEAGQRKGG